MLDLDHDSLRSVHTRRQVAATCRNDTSQQQIASCVLETFCENLCLCNRILSQRHVAKNQIKQNWCNLLQQQNSVAETKIFTRFPSTHEAICRCNVSPQHVAATCCRTCTHQVICRRNLSPSVYQPLGVVHDLSFCSMR